MAGLNDFVPCTDWGTWTRCAICGTWVGDAPTGLNEDRHCEPCTRACTEAIRKELAQRRNLGTCDRCFETTDVERMNDDQFCARCRKSIQAE